MKASRERHTLRSTPTALANVEATAYSSGVGLSTLSINKALFRLHDGSLALVINTEYLAPHLKLASIACYRKWFEDLDLALAIEDVLGVELGNTFNRFCIAARVKVNDLLVRVLEREDDRISRKGGKRGMELLQDMLDAFQSLWLACIEAGDGS